MTIFFQIILILLLILLNGFFVASEFALVAVRKTRINELVKRGNTPARLVQRSLEHIDRYISATQLGITIASLALGWLGEPAIAQMIENLLHGLPEGIVSFTSHTLAVILSFAFITFVQIVVGELAPKNIALQRTEKTALFIIFPLTFFANLFSPFVWLLNIAGNGLIRMLGIHPASTEESVHSEDEIKMILSQSGKSGLIPQQEVEIVQNVFRLGDITVNSVMIPRTDVLAFNVTTLLKDVIAEVADHQHSRFPVYERSIDTIIGFIHVKDIYQAVLKSGGNEKIVDTKIIREVITVPEFKKIDMVMQEMLKKRVHMAVVNDEYGGTAGIVTLEDIIESMIGDIEDEFDEPIQQIRKQKDGSYLIDGNTSITDVQHKFKLVIKGQGYSTIAGLVFGLLGHEPHIGDHIQISNLEFEVKQIADKRITLLQLFVEKKKPLTGLPKQSQ